MGWIVADASSRFGGYKLGPNLRMEPPDGESIPIIAANKGENYDLLDDYGISALFVVYHNDMLYLSVYVNWRFMNLNEAFNSVAGNTTRSFFVYSDLIESLARGDKGINRLDRIARQHDIDYSRAKSLQDKWKADAKMISTIDKLPGKKTLTERVVKKILQAKKTTQTIE